MSSSHLSPSSRRDHGRRGAARLAIALPIVALLVVALAQTAFASGPSNASVTVTPASGPAGTRVTVTGAHFTPNTPVTVGYSKTDCKAGVIAIDGTDQTTAADGSVTVTVTWPSTENGKYIICVTEKGTGKVHQSDTQFEALSASAASINITQTVRSAGKVTVTGANYLPGGSSFEVLYGAAGSNGCANSVATGTVNADGTFTATFDAPFVQADTTYQVTAVSPAKTCGAGAVLAASKSLTVTSAPATGTATVTPKPVPSPNAITFPGIGGGPQTVILCLAGLLALLILLLLLLVFARGRRKNQPVTIQERNTVTVGPGGPSTAGSPQVQRDIYAQDPRGRQTRIATEQTSVEEEPYNP